MKYEKRSFIFLRANMKYEATSSFKKIWNMKYEAISNFKKAWNMKQKNPKYEKWNIDFKFLLRHRCHQTLSLKL